ncbi:MAG: hypothetical protein QW481_07165 [Candidatus Methanomethylicia archaeon]
MKVRLREIRLSDNTAVFDFDEGSRGVSLSEEELSKITLADIKQAFKEVKTEETKTIALVAKRAVDEFQKAKEREEKLSSGKISIETE